MSNIINQINAWLHELEIPISKRYLKTQLESHPNYPSLASITDALDDLKVDSIVLEIDKTKLNSLPRPFLAHLRRNGGEYVVVKNSEILENKVPNFFQYWSNIVVLGEKPDNWDHAENKKWLLKDRKQKIAIFLGLSLAFLFIISSAIAVRKSWEYVLLILVATGGIFTSWMIASKDLGVENKFAEKVCGKGQNCDSIINAKTGGLPLGISWSDVGVVWFSFLLFALLIIACTNNLVTVPLLLLISFFSLPFIIFSLYYQWVVSRKWCRLCMIMVGFLFLQNILSAFQLQEISKTAALRLNGVTLLGLIMFFISVIWFSIKRLLQTNLSLSQEKLANTRLKNNLDFFSALLAIQKKASSISCANSLQLGDLNSPFQIIVASNPYCPPCARVHEILDSLIDENNIGVTVCFTIKTHNKSDRAFIASEYILQLSNNKSNNHKKKLLKDWYETMDFLHFKDKYPLNQYVDVFEEIGGHEKWSKDSEIAFTPTLFINGHQLPESYKVADLSSIIKNFLKSEEDKRAMDVNTEF